MKNCHAFGTGGSWSARRRVLLPPVLACCLAGCYDVLIEGEKYDAFIPSLEVRSEFDREGTVRWAFCADLGYYAGRADATVDDDEAGYDHVKTRGDLEGIFGGVSAEVRFVADDASEFGFSFGVGAASQTFDCTVGVTPYRETTIGLGLRLGLFGRPRLSPNLRLLMEGRVWPCLSPATIVSVTLDGMVGIELSLNPQDPPRAPQYHAGGEPVATGYSPDVRLWAGWRGMRVETVGLDDVVTLMTFAVSGPAAGLTVVF